MLIQPTYLKLEQLLNGRLFRIPEYQRAYSWTHRERSHLFDDIRAVVDSERDDVHFMATVVVLRRERPVSIDADEFDVVEIVDGQQRLTTLVLLMRALATALGASGDAPAVALASRLERLLVKSDDCTQLLLQTNHDTGNSFATYLGGGASPDPSVAGTLAERHIADAIAECEAFVASFPAERLLDLAKSIRLRLAFILHVLDDERTVYTVFEVLNSRGLPVSWFDRLKSMIMQVAFDAGSGNRDEIIRELHRAWSDIYGAVGLRRDVGTEAMRFGATLAVVAHQNRVLGEEAAAEALRDACISSAAGALEQSRWIEHLVHLIDGAYDETRARAVSLVGHARLLALAIRLRAQQDGFDAATTDRLLEQWERSTFRIFGLCRRDSRTKVGDYVRLARDIYRHGLGADEMLDRLRRLAGHEFAIDRAVEHLADADCYHNWAEQLRYFLYRYEEHLAAQAGQKVENVQWVHIWREWPTRSIEHIHPQSRGHHEPSASGIYVHRLGNLMLLPPSVNSTLGDKTFGQKRHAYAQTGLRLAHDVLTRAGDAHWSRSEMETREAAMIDWARHRWADLPD